ncbi:SseB family protein [Spongiactinospora sp. TRM90649]|uniref:SseB family protein n=1 Tax=Spongiactinospora sp. TRM90649 TaxID=3031114 RepID=UPI0023F71467|nr:SseB family protein [Spongiactinospora sp. TRM90649]MDF5752383.1 SseB family protein [Spongiactinospora sp. TRM90649]
MPSIPRPLFSGDDGRADPALAAALAAHAQGEADAREIIAPLSTARLLVPVVAVLTESEIGENGLRQEKSSDMALPKLVGEDGRQAVLAFTGTEPLARWRPDARPIQVTGPQVCQAATREGAAAVVLDVAGPAAFVIEGPLLHTLAALHGPPETVAERLREHGVPITEHGPPETVAEGLREHGVPISDLTAPPEVAPAPRRRFPWSRRR